MLKPTAKFLYRLARLLCLLVLAVAVALAMILANPDWLSPLIKAELAKNGIHTDITQLHSRFSGSHYHLTAELQVDAKTYGITAENAHITADIDWWALMKKQPFIHQLSLENATLNVDRQRLTHVIRQHNRSTTTDRADSEQLPIHLLPQQWTLHNDRINVGKHSLIISGQGQGVQRASLMVKDDQTGKLQADYTRSNQRLTLYSKQLNIAALSGYEATLKQLNAHIDMQHWLNSRVQTELVYQNIPATLSIRGEGHGVRLQASHAEKTLSLLATPTLKPTLKPSKKPTLQQGVKLSFERQDLSAYDIIKPLLPAELRLHQLSGKANGELVIDADKRLTSATLAFHDLAVSHDKGSIDAMNANVGYSDGSWQYNVGLADTTLSAPALFPHGIAPVSGQVIGSYHPDTQRVIVENLTLSGNDFQSVNATATLDLAQQYIHLSADADNIQLNKLQRLLPTLMPKATADWLKSALRFGHKNHSTLTLSGQLNRLFSDKNSVFLLRSQFADTTLQYLPDNPPLFVKEALLVFDKNKLSVNVPNGSINGIPLHGSVHIPDTRHAEIKINAHIRQQQLTRLLPVAAASIAKNAVFAVKRLITGNGKLDMDLFLTLPIADKQQSTAFALDIRGKNLNTTLKSYPKLPVHLNTLVARVNENGLQNLSAKGRQRKNPIAVNLTQQDQRYDITVKTTADPLVLLPKLGLLSASQAAELKKEKIISGKSVFAADIQLLNGTLQHINVGSDLRGIGLDIFSVVQKKPQTTLPLALQFQAQKRRLSATLQNKITLELGLNADGKPIGLQLKHPKDRTRYRPKVAHVKLHIPRFHARHFYEFIKDFSAADTRKKTTRSPALDYRLAVDIDEFYVDENFMPPLKIQGKLTDLAVDSPLLAGRLNYRKNYFQADFSRLEAGKFFDLIKTTEINPEGREVSRIDLAKALPQMQVSIDKVYFRGAPVGQAHVQTSIRDGRYSIDQILLQGHDFFLDASGYEAKEPQGITTHVHVDIKSENIQKIIKLFDRTPFLDAKFIDASFNLSYPGKAHTLNLRQSYGKAKLEAQNVRFLTISSGAGSMLSVIDIAGILKRIALDFKNLTSSKIAFDTLSGNWNIGGGRARTKNAGGKGSLIDLQVAGAVDLYRRTFDDVDVTVIPKASNIIPVVGAVTGGAVGAAVGFVVQQIVGGGINKAVDLSYVVSGTWLDPKLEKKKDDNGEEKPQKKKAKKKKTKSVQKNSTAPAQKPIILESLRD